MPPCSALQRAWDSLENLEPRPVEDLQVYCKTQTYQPVPQVGRQNSPRAEFRTFGLCETCYWQTIKMVRICHLCSRNYWVNHFCLPAIRLAVLEAVSERIYLRTLPEQCRTLWGGGIIISIKWSSFAAFPPPQEALLPFFTSLQRSTVGRQSGVPFCCCWGVLLGSCSAERATSIGGSHLLVGWQPGRSAGVWEKGRALGVLRCPDQWVIKISTFIKRFQYKDAQQKHTENVCASLAFVEGLDCYAEAGEQLLTVSGALPSTALWLLSSCPYPLCPKSLPPELEETWSIKSLKRRGGCCCVCKRQDGRSTVERNSLGKWICSSGYYLD